MDKADMVILGGLAGLATASAFFMGLAISRLKNNSQVNYVRTTSECVRAIKIIRNHMSTFPVLGLDCEWEPECRTRNEVQVISLATLEGYCVILQISRFSVPESLQSLLLDPGIIKVGVGIQIDQQHLASTGLGLNSWVDIRHLDKTSLLDKTLKGMAKRFLGEDLDKGMQLSGNWGGDLTEDQIRYAAKDAEAGIRICKALLDGQHKYESAALAELRQFAERSYPSHRFLSTGY